MGDYVSRQYLLDEYDRQHQGPPGGARKIITGAPAEDVIPVVHSEWIYRTSDCVCVCKKCGYEYKWRDADSKNFCHNCGAKMEEVKLTQKKIQEEIRKEKEEAIICFIGFSIFIFILCLFSIIID